MTASEMHEADSPSPSPVPLKSLDSNPLRSNEEGRATSADGTFASHAQPAEKTADEVSPPPAAAPPAGPTFPDGGLDAWLTVLGGFLTFFAGLGFISSYAVFQAYYSENQLRGRSQDAIAWIGSIQLWGNFGFGLPAGILLDRYGPKVPMLLGTALIFLGTMTTSACHDQKYYQFFLSQGLCSAFGYGLVFNPAQSVPNQWFLKKRGLVGGLVVGGTSFGGALWPIMLNRMLNYDGVSFGWTLRACGFIQLALLLTATCLIKTRFPRRMIKGPPPFKEMFTNLRFNAFTLAELVGFFGLYSPYIFISAYGVHRGASLSTSFYMSSVLNATSFFGRLLVGLTSDRLGTFNTIAASTAITGLIAFCWPAVTTNAGNFVWAGFYGFWAGAVVSLLAPCIARIAPNPRVIGQYIGVNTTIAALGVLAAEPVAGRIITNNKGSFSAAQFFIAAMITASAIGFAIARLTMGTGLKV